VKPIGYNKRRMRRDYVKIQATVRVYDCFPAIFSGALCRDIADFIDIIKRGIYAHLSAR